MAQREALGGPTILDINTGYIRDSAGLDNLFNSGSGSGGSGGGSGGEVYTEADFAHYGRIIHTLREAVLATFQLSQLYFTAPTFITRLDGERDWQPRSIHDEYFHPHAGAPPPAHYVTHAYPMS
jgi:hypothetical protein